jgi:protein-disulfide isomerase
MGAIPDAATKVHPWLGCTEAFMKPEKLLLRWWKPLAAALVTGLAVLAGSTANVHGNALGNPNAPVVIEVFSDFQCPGCKALHDYDLHRIIADYVEPGKVYLIYRYFPIPAHRYGRVCAEYACAAARVGRYQKVADALFAEQAAILSNGNVEAVANNVLTPAEAAQVKYLLNSPEVEKEIDTDVAEGQAVPVTSTPTFLVTANGKSQAIPGLQNYTLFRQYVDAILPK